LSTSSTSLNPVLGLSRTLTYPSSMPADETGQTYSYIATAGGSPMVTIG